ncbi:MAG TPA: acyl-CoA dehydrogenase family protein [Actinomycetota bacterium]
MDPFLQDPPRVPHPWRADTALRYALERLLPPDVYAEALPDLEAMAEVAITEMAPLSRLAEANPPRHVAFDPWGRRIDRIDVDPAWLRIVEIGQRHGVVAIPYEDRFGEHARAVQFGILTLYNPHSATGDCPLSMTDAAVRVLLNEDADLAARYVPKLIAREGGWTSGQWMTEKEGGSDVGRTGTTARRAADGTWTLHGTKWFTSATTADVALALARPEGAEQGSRGLSLFLLELSRPDGAWNGLTVRRLKDKLGTKALPTAELDLDGTVAVPVGDLGRGVAKISAMLNVTRVHAAFGSLAAVGLALRMARDYAYRREAFGRRLADLPAHRGWIARIAAEYEAMVALGFGAAELLGRMERTGEDQALARVVMPLAKMSIARRAVWATSNLMESFGGAGYLEDTGIPRILRDCHVNCIWEGTTSIMALDVVRALVRSPETAGAFLADVEARARAADGPLLDEPQRAVLSALEQLRPLMAEPSEAGARRLAWGMARTYQAALLCEAAGWALAKQGDERVATAARLFASRPLIGSEPPVGDDELGALAFGEEPPEE